MKFKKVISLLVLTCVLIGSVSTVSAMSSTQFYQWLSDNGTPEYSVSGTYRANYNTYVKYNLVVYGSSGDVSGNDYRQGEYRYLGYTYMEGKYTNLDFPNDETGNKKPEEWDYVTVSGALESWDSLEQTVQRPYMLHTRLRGHGATTLTAADIGTSRAKVQSAASWGSAGSIYTYKSNGYYATFTVPSMGKGVLSASMEPDDSTVYVTGSDTCVDTGVSLDASVNKPVREVKFIKVVFSCGGWRKVRYYHNTNSISIHQDAILDLPRNIPGQITVDAHVTSESIFGDKLSKDLSCRINVRSSVDGNTAPPSAPGPTPRPTPRPTNPPPVPTDPVTTPAPTPKPTGGSGGNGDDPWANVLRFMIVNLSGSWNHWAHQSHRFLALEETTLSVWVLGRAEKAEIRLSPELEAMTYVNSRGHQYSYADDFFGEEVRFPEDSTIYPDNQSLILTRFSWTYSLPMCDETVGWDNERKKSSYYMKIKVYDKNGNSIEYILDDIDITGNIYELLYPQPAD